MKKKIISGFILFVIVTIKLFGFEEMSKMPRADFKENDELQQFSIKINMIGIQINKIDISDTQKEVIYQLITQNNNEKKNLSDDLSIISGKIKRIVEGVYEYNAKIKFVNENISELFDLKRKIEENNLITYLKILNILTEIQKKQIENELKKAEYEQNKKMEMMRQKPDDMSGGHGRGGRRGGGMGMPGMDGGK